MQSFLDHFGMLRDRRQDVALATLVAIDGGSEKRLGSRLWVTESGETYGSLTVGGCIDGRARDEAFHVLAERSPRRIKVALGEDGLDFGMSCAGTVDVYIQPCAFSSPDSPIEQALDRVVAEVGAGRTAVYATPLDDTTPSYAIASSDDVEVEPVRTLLDGVESACTYVDGDDTEPDALLQSSVPRPLLVVVGAAPIAEPLVRLGSMLGFRVVVVDGKSERLPRERFSTADEVLLGIPSEICSRLALDGRSTVVLTAHDYRYEVPVLKDVLQRDVGYVGFVASRRRGHAVLDFLARSGVESERLNRVHVPVGLDIGALTPAEIALSIMAEVLADRSKTTCLPLVDLPDLDRAGPLIAHAR